MTMVSAQKVRKSFGKNVVLNDISLEVERGEVVCILGPSGSGKSTFLRCINHLERPDGGRIVVDGETIGYRQEGNVLHELPESALTAQRRSIGMVFQRFNLFPHMTVLENITCGPHRPSLHLGKLPAGGQGHRHPGHDRVRGAQPGPLGRLGRCAPDPRRLAGKAGHQGHHERR
ncbi:ATP-binding cassette domain-containing protein [Sediminivirga luteola]|uniref:ATP-binding cassette domain-containing protein n=1 Tax=Sediminivirga luteola TaxID=1774748 RepID=UPI003BB5A4FF